MTDWTAFAGFAGAVVVLLLVLARASQSVLQDGAAARRSRPAAPTDAAVRAEDPGEAVRAEDPGEAVRAEDPEGTARPPAGEPAFSPGELLANVLLTHGLFAGLVAGAAAFWGVPAAALGLAAPAAGAVAWGIAAGVVLYLANELGAAAAGLLGVDPEEALRELLAPEGAVGWAVLLGGVLPVVAGAEELLFRGVLVGTLAAGFGWSPWALAVVSSAAFALGHGAQGRGGVVVTGLLGFALAAAFVLSGSLLLVIVAHYVVNALEFVVHEGLGVEWPPG